MKAPDDGEQYELAVPKPDALIESLRSVGYSLPTAVADIVDNSIAAEATSISISLVWSGPESAISILDDGRGMSAARLFEAMRPGSQSPLDERTPKDLGRFGLGLKTASFSQCRSVTVASKERGGELHIYRWDLDYVERHHEWRLLRGIEQDAEHFLSGLAPMPSGTLVLWRKLDRVVDNRPATNNSAHESFQQRITELKEHLSMTFHRFISGTAKQSEGTALKIYVNGKTPQNLIGPWDPFLREHPATWKSPVDVLGHGRSEIRVQGFVLPHKDRLTDEQYRSAAGPRGWNAQQGFYVYRNDRILVPGDWLRLGRTRQLQNEEHCRLARLSIDISNTQDFDWSLDVKKSTARPPNLVRERLTDLAEAMRARARQIFFYRGEVGPNPKAGTALPLQRPWITALRAGHNTYRVNRDHPLVAGVLKSLGPLKEDVSAMLRLIEETVPIERIWLDTAEAPGNHAVPYEGLDETVVWGDIKKTFEILRAAGTSTAVAIQYIRGLEPFNRYPHLIEKLEGL